MPQEKITNATGAIDGVNRTFSVGEAYQSGTLVPRWNGQEMLHRDGDPFTETDPSTGEFTADGDFLPCPGDTVSARFVDLSPIAPETEVIEIDAVVEFENEIESQVDVELRINAEIENELSLDADVEVEFPIDSVVESEFELTATVEVC